MPWTYTKMYTYTYSIYAYNKMSFRPKCQNKNFNKNYSKMSYVVILIKKVKFIAILYHNNI